MSVKSTGEGENLVEVSEYAPWSVGVYAYFGSRLAYTKPSTTDRARADTESKLTRAIGTDAELGMLYRALYTGKDNDNWRGMVGLRWAFIGGVTNGFVYELQGGLGYELTALPWIGVTVTPYVEPGILYVPSGIGADEGNTGRFTSLLAGTADDWITVRVLPLVGALVANGCSRSGVGYALALRSRRRRVSR